MVVFEGEVPPWIYSIILLSCDSVTSRSVAFDASVIVCGMVFTCTVWVMVKSPNLSSVIFWEEKKNVMSLLRSSLHLPMIRWFPLLNIVHVSTIFSPGHATSPPTFVNTSVPSTWWTTNPTASPIPTGSRNQMFAIRGARPRPAVAYLAWYIIGASSAVLD